MMITKEQAIEAGEGRNRYFHYGICKKDIGPRGGETLKVEVWRANGKCQTWKTRPNEFKLPIKHGLRDYGYLHHHNACEFHLEVDCEVMRVVKEPVIFKG